MVADFRRNRRPDCVGITGRFASDCALLNPESALQEQYDDKYTRHHGDADDRLVRTFAVEPHAFGALGARPLAAIKKRNRHHPRY
jgi:hypothetical protein